MSMIARTPNDSHSRNRSKNFESRKDALLRLKNRKEELKIALDLKEEIHFKTGNEFSYKMHSIKVKNDQMTKIKKIDGENAKREIVKINFEIIRIEKKLGKMNPIYKTTRIKFGKDNSSKKITQEQELKADCKKVIAYQEYIEKLIKAKQKLQTKIKEAALKK